MMNHHRPVKIRSLLLLLATVSLLAGTGCNEKNVPLARGQGEPAPEFGVILSQQQAGQLRHDTAFGAERTTRDEGGILHVAVPVRSAIQHTLYLEYQYSFFDATGMKVEGPMGWLPITLEAGSPGTIQFASTGRQAVAYQVVIRYQR